MAARNTVKALIIRGDKILVNRCHSRFGNFFSLPGGGQERGETLPNTVVREVLEETGYSIRPLGMVGIYERITENFREEGEEGDPLCHKIYFIYRCKLLNVDRVAPTETDRFQTSCEWIPLKDLHARNLFPKAIRDNIPKLLQRSNPLYIGSEVDKHVIISSNERK